MYATTQNGTSIMSTGIGRAYFPDTLNKIAEFERKYYSSTYEKRKKTEPVSSKPKTGIEMFI